MTTCANVSQRTDILGQLVELYDLLRADAVVSEDFTPRLAGFNLLALECVVVGINSEYDVLLFALFFTLFASKKR